MTPPNFEDQHWPELPLEAWKDTYETLHRYLQIVGKLRLALCPMMNHWWQVALQVTSSGLTTGPIPYRGLSSFQIDLDFIDHELSVRTSWGPGGLLPLEPRTVAAFFHELMTTLLELDIEVEIWDVPVEIPEDTTPFSLDEKHGAYDRRQVQRWWQIVSQADQVMKEFRARFTGKASPVHFFWGSFDLAASRFSGRPAPERQGADSLTRESYSEEVMSVGFWPGSTATQGPAFYAYAVPEPAGFATAAITPDWAYYDSGLRELLLPYDRLRQASSPRATLLAFLQSSYEAAAELGHWDRARLERPLIVPHGGLAAAPGAAWTLPEGGPEPEHPQAPLGPPEQPSAG